MSDSTTNDRGYKRSIKDPELEALRQKIMDAIIFSEHFWIVYKMNTFGMAGFIDLKYKRSYIEILYFTPSRAQKQNGRVLQINSPLLRQLHFRKLFEEPDMDADGFVNPTEIYKRILNLAENEIQAYLFILDNQIRKLNEEYENYAVQENPYIRKIRTKTAYGSYEFTIDFEMFPKRPKITLSEQTEKIMSSEKLLELDILKNWSEENPMSIPYIIDKIMEEIVRKEGGSLWNSDTQQMIFHGVNISSKIPEIDMRMHRGETLGIIYQGKESEKGRKHTLMELFQTIAGVTKPKSGRITLFGNEIGYGPKRGPVGTYIVSSTLDPRIEELKVKKALTKNVTITTDMPQFKRRKHMIDEILEVSGLKNKQKELVSSLKVIDRIKFAVARVLLQSPEVIMFSIPAGSLGRLEMNQFNRYLDRLKKTFHVIVLVHGPREIVADCDKILTITESKSDAGAVDDLVLKIPQAGEVIMIELNNLNPDVLNREVLSAMLEDAIVIEEREYEKYKIFSQENPDELIIKLMNIIGPFLYNFKRFKPSLAEYLEFMEVSS